MLLLRRVSGLAPAAATCLAVCSAGVALLGYTLLSFLVFTRNYAPPTAFYARPLYFDYTGPVAIAVAHFCPARGSNANLPQLARGALNVASPHASKPRLLNPGMQVSVDVVLQLPSDHLDLFQVTGELLANATLVTAKSTRTHINAPQPYAYKLARQLLWLPLHVIGWGHDDSVRVQLTMMDSYEEREDAPVAAFRARLASRNATQGVMAPPPVHRGEVQLRVKMGLLQTLLMWLRPGLFLSAVLLAVGLGCSLGGTAAALGLGVAAWLLHRWARRAAEDHKQRMRGGKPALQYAHKAAARRKGSSNGALHLPYGTTMDDALSYSLAHGRILTPNGGEVDQYGHEGEEGEGEEYEQQGEEYGQGMYVRSTGGAFYAPPSREGSVSTLSQYSHKIGSGLLERGGSIGGDGRGSPTPHPPAKQQESSPGWSGSSSGASGAAGGGGGGGVEAVPATGAGGGGKQAERRGSGAATQLPNVLEREGGKGDAESEEEEGEGGGGNGGEGEGEGEAGEDVVARGGGGAGSGGAGEEAAVARKHTPAEAERDSDLQADTDTAGGGAGEMRRRPGFTWKA